jgi:hypothetical protein
MSAVGITAIAGSPRRPHAPYAARLARDAVARDHGRAGVGPRECGEDLDGGQLAGPNFGAQQAEDLDPGYAQIRGYVFSRTKASQPAHRRPFTLVVPLSEWVCR